MFLTYTSPRIPPNFKSSQVIYWSSVQHIVQFSSTLPWRTCGSKRYSPDVLLVQSGILPKPEHTERALWVLENISLFPFRQFFGEVVCSFSIFVAHFPASTPHFQYLNLKGQNHWAYHFISTWPMLYVMNIMSPASRLSTLSHWI